MSPTAIALLGLVGLHLALVAILLAMRGLAMLVRRHPMNTFRADGSDLSAGAQRISRAHANSYENLPAMAAVMLYAIATDGTNVTDPLALWLLVARAGQATVHVISTSVMAVSIRFTLFAIQLGIVTWWLWLLLNA